MPEESAVCEGAAVLPVRLREFAAQHDKLRNANLDDED
jgi:hypothetical protein